MPPNRLAVSEPAAVPSPCIDVCAIDPRSGLCAGCLRTLDEIAAWGALGEREKRAVWKLLGQRRRALAAAPPPPEESP